MKIKKTLALVMSAALSFATLTGCSQATLNYTDELVNTSKWEAMNSECNGSVTVEAGQIKQDITFASTGYTSKNKGYAELKFNDPKGVVNIPEMKVYTDGVTAYFNKSFYEGMYTMNGQAVPDALKNITADYIGIDMEADKGMSATDKGMNAAELKALMTEPDAIIKLSKTIFGDSDIDLPYVQNGREYTLNLNSDEMVDLGVKGIKAVSNNLENLNTKFNLGLTSEDIAEIKTGLADKAFDEGVVSVKQAISGSNVSTKETFADDKYTMDTNINLVIKDTAKVSVAVNGTSTKAEVKEVTMPTSSVKFTKEEFGKLLMPEQQSVINNSALAKVIEAA